MMSDVFRPSLSYLPRYLVPTMFNDFYPITSFLDPPTYPKIGRHLWMFPYINKCLDSIKVRTKEVSQKIHIEEMKTKMILIQANKNYKRVVLTTKNRCSTQISRSVVQNTTEKLS